MQIAALPANEPARLEVLRRYQSLAMGAEQTFKEADLELIPDEFWS